MRVLNVQRAVQKMSKSMSKEGDAMAWQTPKTDWKVGDIPTAGDFNRIEENIRIIGEYNRAPGYGVANGTNAKTITLDPAPTSYYDGLCFAFKNVTQNTGAVTINVNGLGARPIKKPNGNDIAAGNLKAGSVYTVRYNGTNFILQGSDSSGNAMPEHVLAGKTFSNDNGPDQVGTMPNQGQKIIVPGTTNIAIPAGYHDGTGYVVGSPNLIPANIKKGVNIFGIIGTLETQITVQPISFSTTLTAPKTTEPEYNQHRFNTIIITLPSDFKMFIYKSNSFSSSGVTMSAPYEYSSNKSWATLDFGSYSVCSVDLDGNQKKFLFDLILAIRLPDGTTKYLVTYTDPNDSNGDNFNYDDYCKFIPEGDFESASINWANPKISIYSSIYDSNLGPTSFDIRFNGILYVI